MQTRSKEFRLQLYARAAAPCRDYYGLTINNETIVLNTWNISHGPHVYPKMSRSYLYEYSENKSLQNDIERLFGVYVNDYILQLANDKITIQCLPTRAFLCILGFLARKDIIHLSQTSKIFFQLCQTDNVWKMIFKKILRRKPSSYEEQDAIDRGWKEVLSNRLYRLNNITSKNHSSGNRTQSKIKYNSLKLETDDKVVSAILSKASGDGIKSVSIKKSANKEIKTPQTTLSKKSMSLNDPVVNLSVTSIQKLVEEQYTSTLARRTMLSTSKVRVAKSAKK